MTPDSAPKCLLVDDDTSMLHLLSEYIEMLGMEAITARDGDEGIAAFRMYHPSLVVSDIHMPNRNGLLLLHDVKYENPDCPVILVTGLLMNYHRAMQKDPVKPDDLIEKPFDLSTLQRAIERLRPAMDEAWSKVGKGGEESNH
jgi:DNA-binding NtrC family response regulator